HFNYLHKELQQDNGHFNNSIFNFILSLPYFWFFLQSTKWFTNLNLKSFSVLIYLYLRKQDSILAGLRTTFSELLRKRFEFCKLDLSLFIRVVKDERYVI